MDRTEQIDDVKRATNSAKRKSARDHLSSILLLVLSVTISLLAAEGVLRIKNASMTNYDVEMWRYSKELKALSADPDLAFDHVKSRDAILEGVNIRLNEWGLRGGPIEPLPPGERRILFLGGSITLGWGVPEEQTVEAQLQAMLAAQGTPAQVLNAGVGNYNAKRYVSRFFKELTGLNPTDIVVQYFLRDAEDLPPGGGNLLLRHSELAVTLWIAFHRLFDATGDTSLVDHYRKVYDPDAPGFVTMQEELKALADYCNAHHIRLYFAMTPDIHNLVDYQFGFIHDLMRKNAEADGYTYIDLLPSLRGIPPEQLFAMPGDPHPNALGHTLMAEGILPVISQIAQTVK